MMAHSLPIDRFATYIPDVVLNDWWQIRAHKIALLNMPVDSATTPYYSMKRRCGLGKFRDLRFEAVMPNSAPFPRSTRAWLAAAWP